LVRPNFCLFIVMISLHGNGVFLWHFGPMSNSRKNIAVVCGGYSGEAAVSMRSAAMIMNHMDRTLYQPVKVIVGKDRWFAEWEGSEVEVNRADFTLNVGGSKFTFDGVFMIIHGTPGEDGIMQGYFELLGIPTTTGDTLNMSLTFNKKMTTRILSAMKFNTAASVEVDGLGQMLVSDIIAVTGLPCFVKPNRGGSSLATTMVENADDLSAAVVRAATVDRYVIVEEFMSGVEVTCGVIQIHGKVTALPITEIVTENKFFDYEAKYQGKSNEITPARLSESVYKEVQRLSVKIYSVLKCRGMIRVDYIIRDEIPYVIEVNTTPGFSEASIIPQQAAVAGIDKKSLISFVMESSF
jgi:D-alanine-D-alanine ligase